MKLIKLGYVFFVIGIVAACSNSGSNSGIDKLISWIDSNSHKIETLELSEKHDDLEQLNKIVGDAKVVCIGESRHDIREQFQLKHRFIKYLVEELDFSIFILEASMPFAEIVNSFIQHGEGDLDGIMENLPGWFLWDTQEMREILNWMRVYNIDPDNLKKLQFHGIDIVAPGYALNSVLAYMKKIDGSVYDEFIKLDFRQDQIDDSWWMATFQRFSGYSGGEKLTLRANYKKLYNEILGNEDHYISKSSNVEYNWILRQAYCAMEACRMFTAGSRMEMGLIRDSAMANNALWINDINSEDDKAIIWAHNVHITKGEFIMTGESGSIKGMGYILGQELKENMVSIGASFNKGVFQDQDRIFPPADVNTMDGLFAMTGVEYALIELNNDHRNSVVIEWLNSDQILMGQEFEMTCIPAESFDAIFYVNNISKTIPNPASLERFRNMN